MKRKLWVEVVKWVFAYVVAFIILIYFGSCSAIKKAERQTQNALIRYPAVVAKIAREAFPCIVTRSDTLITYTDTTIVVNCPTGNDFEGGDISMAEDVVKHDTLNKHDTIIHFRKVPFKIPFRTIDIKQHVADSAQNKVLQSVIDTRDNTISKLQLVIDSNAETIKQKNKYVLAFWLMIGLFSLGFILKLIIKFK